jgi:hypothetical protein
MPKLRCCMITCLGSTAKRVLCGWADEERASPSRVTLTFGCAVLNLKREEFELERDIKQLDIERLRLNGVL